MFFTCFVNILIFTESLLNSFFVFWYFHCHHIYSIDKSVNVWERKQADKNSLIKNKIKKINSNVCVMLLANYGFVSVDGDVETSFDMWMTQRRCKQWNRKAVRQHRVERQVVSSHT